MGFDESELIGLSDEIWDLLQTIEDIRKDSSDKGKKISRKEARSLAKALLALSVAVLRDCLD